MATIFRADGHLEEDALLALLRDELPDELARLELAEHLAYCDLCLQRYTDLLAEEILSTPQNSCRDTLWQRLRLRTLAFFSQRYAAAAAAVLLALTLLWGSALPGLIKDRGPDQPHIPYTQALQKRWEGAMEQTSSWLSGLMDRLDPLQERTIP